MDVSEVTVLARRANGLLVATAILMIVCGFAAMYSVMVLTGEIEPNKKLLYILYIFSFFGPRHRHRYYHSSPETMAFWCALSYAMEFALCFWAFIRRLSVCKVIIEYDDFGLYIYKKGVPVTLLRYEALWSVYVHEEIVDTYEDFDSCASVKTQESFFGLCKTGVLRFEVPDGFIILSGVYQVKEVEKEIKRMVNKNRREFLEAMEERIEKNQRKRELEELAKHNPNT